MDEDGDSDDDVDRQQVLKDAKVVTWLAVHRRHNCWFVQRHLKNNNLLWIVCGICAVVQWKAQATQPVQWTIQIGCQVDGVVGGPWRVAPWESSHRSLRELHRLGKTQKTIALLVQQCPVTKSLNVIKYVWAANVHTYNTVSTAIPNVIGYHYSSALLCPDCPPETNNYICTGSNILGKSYNRDKGVVLPQTTFRCAQIRTSDKSCPTFTQLHRFQGPRQNPSPNPKLYQSNRTRIQLC